jgi:hypothetical protein
MPPLTLALREGISASRLCGLWITSDRRPLPATRQSLNLRRFRGVVAFPKELKRRFVAIPGTLQYLALVNR